MDNGIQNNGLFLITAAGGNGTAIRLLDTSISRAEYVERGAKLGKEMERFGAEQAGFLIPSEARMEMAGGEFCGNASRAAALLLAELQEKPQVSFTVSGFDGTVQAFVEKVSDSKYFVKGVFPNMPVIRRSVVLSSGQPADVVDLGGITHVIIEGSFPVDPAVHTVAHKVNIEELGLTHLGAVGVIWYERNNAAVKMHPVVWVKDVDTFFYEQSCGSGTIAVGAVTQVSSIIQPTGNTIEVFIGTDAVELQSEMEIIRIEE